MQTLLQLHQWLLQVLWQQPLHSRPRWQRLLVVAGRLTYGIVRVLFEGDLSLRAMSLAYTTLLAVVPLLAVSFTVLRAFGVHNQFRPLLFDFLKPLGDKRFEIANHLLDLIQNLQMGVLGSVGLVMLLYTILLMTHRIEETFNAIWHVATPRNLPRRLLDYLSIIIIGPLLVFLGLGVTRTALHSAVVQWLTHYTPFAALLLGVSVLAPYAMICLAFTILYALVPNTHVHLTTALLSGILAGVLWILASIVFAQLIVDSTDYSAVYASFAGVVLFIVWTYTAWLIILVGGQAAFYLQNPRYLDPRIAQAPLTGRVAVTAGLELMYLIGKAHLREEPLWTFPRLERHCHMLPPGLLPHVLQRLEQRRLIAVSHDEIPVYLPTRDVAHITLLEIIHAVSSDDSGIRVNEAAVQQALTDLDQAIGQAFGGRSLHQLIDAEQDLAG